MNCNVGFKEQSCHFLVSLILRVMLGGGLACIGVDCFIVLSLFLHVLFCSVTSLSVKVKSSMARSLPVENIPQWRMWSQL